MASRIRHIRTTVAQLASRISSSGLLQGEWYLVTDATPPRPAIGTATNAVIEVQPYDAAIPKTNLTQIWNSPQLHSLYALTSGTSISVPLNLGNDFSLTLSHAATLANPSNLDWYVGLKGSIVGVNSGGSRTLSYGSYWFPIGSATAPAIPPGSAANWRVDFHVTSSTRIDFSVSGVGV